MTESFDWTEFLDLDGLVNTEPAGTTASVPFIITQAQEARLRELGYSDAGISTMTPEDAHRSLQLPPM